MYNSAAIFGFLQVLFTKSLFLQPKVSLTKYFLWQENYQVFLSIYDMIYSNCIRMICEINWSLICQDNCYSLGTVGRKGTFGCNITESKPNLSFGNRQIHSDPIAAVNFFKKSARTQIIVHQRIYYFRKKMIVMSKEPHFENKCSLGCFYKNSHTFLDCKGRY